MEKNNLLTIKCPICGREYLPAEIYLPNEFFGKPQEINRTTSGNIDFYLGKDMDLNEEYVCDSCGTLMKIHAKLSFDVDATNVSDEEYVTNFNKPSKIKLEEKTLF